MVAATTTETNTNVAEKALVDDKKNQVEVKSLSAPHNGEMGSLQQELNEILEAWFELVSEEDIVAYQQYVEDIRGEKVAERALCEPAMAPMFELTDQDGDVINTRDLLQEDKPIVLVFYRGKWCPHCNCTLMHYSKKLKPALDERNARMIAISPMMPDGTALMATKKQLSFSVCSDIGGQLARQFGITFTVSPTSQEYMTKWGEHVPSHNAAKDWEIPLPAVYLIGTDGRIVWSFLDNDPGTRAEPREIIEALDSYSVNKGFRQKLLISKGLLSSNGAGTLQDSSTPKKASTAQTYRIRAANDETEQDLEQAQVTLETNNKEKKAFNRTIGFVTKLRRRTLSVFRKKNNKPKKNNEDTKSCGDVQSSVSEDDTDGFSIKSEEHLPLAPRNKDRFFRGKEQPPMEFLMNYVGGYN